MGFVGFLDEISPTFLGIIVGSLFTIIGVILTNASNTKRLRLQHEHEQHLESKERDATLRRDTYLSAIEAISAGMVAVGHYGELSIPEGELMRAYTEKIPAISKVIIVGKDETLKAVVHFNTELTGVFMRLGSKRLRLEQAWKRNTDLEEQVRLAQLEQERLRGMMDESNANGSQDETQWRALQRKYELEKARIERLTAEQDELMGWLMPGQMQLIQQSQQEIARLDQLLTKVIGLMRAELELPFDAERYSRILAENHQKQAEYLEAFFKEYEGEAETA